MGPVGDAVREVQPPEKKLEARGLKPQARCALLDCAALAMPIEFLNLLIFVGLAAVFLLVTLAAGRLLRPSTPTVEKGLGYECGERPMGPGWFNFNPRFYVVALIFLIFDVEVAFTYPVA